MTKDKAKYIDAPKDEKELEIVIDEEKRKPVAPSQYKKKIKKDIEDQIDSMKHSVKECNGNFLATHATIATVYIRDAIDAKAINKSMAEKLQQEVYDIPESFVEYCTCLPRKEAGKYFTKKKRIKQYP